MTDLKQLIQAFGGLITTLTAIIAAVALLVFFWGLAKFIFKLGSSEKAVEEGRNIMVWGLIALFVMLSVWGIINFFQKELNLPNPGASYATPSQIEPKDIYATPSFWGTLPTAPRRNLPPSTAPSL